MTFWASVVFVPLPLHLWDNVFHIPGGSLAGNRSDARHHYSRQRDRRSQFRPRINICLAHNVLVSDGMFCSHCIIGYLAVYDAHLFNHPRRPEAPELSLLLDAGINATLATKKISHNRFDKERRGAEMGVPNPMELPLCTHTHTQNEHR